MNKIIVLESGKKLHITMAPFADAKALYQVCMKELKDLKLDSKTDIDVNFWKDLAFTALSSKEIEAALFKCFEKVTYDDKRITNVDDVFESAQAREDYIIVCVHVMKENIMPFMKSLYAKWSDVLKVIVNVPG